MAVMTAGNSKTFQTSTPADRVIRITRLFDAPREIIFDVMTKPEHVARWWGQLGDGYSVPVCEIDLRVGGKWRFVNRTPKNEDVEFYGVYHEIGRPGRLVNTEIFAAFPDVESMVMTTLTEENGKTRVTVDCTYPSNDVRDMVLASGMERGAATSYDRLEDVANEMRARG